MNNSPDNPASHFHTMGRGSVIDHRWHNAALLGSVWASAEIVIGSFLHNIKFPLTGTILSAIGIAILIAGHSLWKEKGVVWRAGIICAVMKSVSPSSAILGPMIGITVEAFIVEGAIRLFGGNGFGYIAGGAIACTTPVIQKTISYVFTYGTNVAVLFEKLVEFASKNLPVPSLESSDVILAIIAVNISIGAIAALFGLSVGMRTKELLNQRFDKSPAHTIHDTPRPTALVIRYSLLLLMLHAVVLVSGLILQSYYFLLYAVFCYYRYPQVVKRFRRPAFWVEIGLVSILAGIIIGEFTLSDWRSGLIIGTEMFLRAIFVVAVFSAISVEFRNPKIVNYVFRHRLANLSAALETAFDSLPSMIDSIEKERSFFKHPIDSLSRIMVDAFQRTRTISKAPNIFVLTGEKHSGKTTFLKEFITDAEKLNISVSGILQIGVWKGNTRYGYDLLDVQTKDVIPLCRTDLPNEGIVTGKFSFSSEAIRHGREILSVSPILRSDIVIIDEIGPLELSGEGWAQPLSDLVQRYTGVLIIVIRRSLVDEVCSTFMMTPSTVLDIEGISVDEMTKIVTKDARNTIP